MENLILDLGKLKTSFTMLEKQNDLILKDLDRTESKKTIKESLLLISALETATDYNYLSYEVKELRNTLDRLLRIPMKQPL
ncbi:hypothetical protein [Gaoshiqia sediminis]|uniref:Uncharacterized protein n=1 Tax=Gaoshiqia sediminis TaxID=2986998 RepID=A0AA41Y757_9BACT|nr:hypothetical protein [Gaoshiqia sediminis]MCW0484671.1 hypothetical protein [Gaoshiqia sediminis]